MGLALLASLAFGSSIGLLVAKCKGDPLRSPKQLSGGGRPPKYTSKYRRQGDDPADSARLTRKSSVETAEDVFDL